MPKIKTHSGAKKRFKFTATGKVKYRKPGQRHLLTGMESKRGRHLRRTTTLNPIEAKVVKKYMPYE